MAINKVIQTRPDNAQAGGLVVSDVRSWYSDATTLGIRDLIMMR
jgi:hypothetical protein